MRKLFGFWATFHMVVSGTRAEFNNSKTVVNLVTLDDQPIPDYSSFIPLSSSDSIFDLDKKADGSEDVIHVDLPELKKSVQGANYTWQGCNNLESVTYCYYTFGTGMPDPVVLRKCMTAYGCCPDSSSSTLFNDCIWNGCDGEKDALHNSTAYCDQWVLTHSGSNITDCFKEKGCCDDQAQNATQKSPTGYVSCPYSLPEYAGFFIGIGAMLIVSIAVQGIAYHKNWRNLLKSLGWIAIGSTSFGFGGATIAYFAKGAAAVEVGSISGLLVGAVGSGYLVYRKNRPAVPSVLPSSSSCCVEPDCQVELSSSCCRIVCDCNFFRRQGAMESKRLRTPINDSSLYADLIDPPIQKLEIT